VAGVFLAMTIVIVEFSSMAAFIGLVIEASTSEVSASRALFIVVLPWSAVISVKLSRNTIFVVMSCLLRRSIVEVYSVSTASATSSTSDSGLVVESLTTNSWLSRWSVRVGLFLLRLLIADIVLIKLVLR